MVGVDIVRVLQMNVDGLSIHTIQAGGAFVEVRPTRGRP